ncbi:protein ELYS [Solea solea]|uniref:protein ELYS n=1 Tax=Solea solea TaxID=90069 RepID=UPI00272ADC3F|nr:protein ELYS [Solea solea]
MHNLTAQVTSSLLPFPGVTVNALGEDEITLDSVLHGKFTVGRSGLAWLACGPHLEVVHAVTGERLSAYCFSGGGEHPPNVLAARDFSWLKRSGLLVGLEEAEGNVLCLYDLAVSRVVKSVVIPGRITAIEPLVSYGGASTSTQHLHQSLRWFFGIAAVVTDLGHVLLVDLCLDDLSGSQSELEASALQVVTKSPADIPRLREVGTRQGRHLCLQLNGPSGVGATALQYISRTNQLAVGFANGYLQLWNMKTLKKEYHSQLEGGGVAVYAFTFQEPENDPRNCCYLWAVQSSQDLEGDTVSLHLLQLAFSERKCLSSGKILYEGLEYCEERYSQELSGTGFPLRTQTTNTRLLSCRTIEKFRSHPDRDDSMNEAASPDTSVSLFSWQVKAYGQGTPSTFIGVFDINRWYHAQMPDSLRMGESLQNCPYLAVWSLDSVVHMVSPHVLLDVVVHDRSLARALPFTCPPPEQYFNPTNYNFDATCLLNSGIVHLTCPGYQKETLSFLRKAAPCSSDIISACYSRCLMSGLLPSRLADTQASSLSQEEQLDAILSTAVETSALGLITGCIKQWTAEEQPGSALNLRYVLDWAWNKVVQTKEELDGICAPLFDSSSNFTDPQTLQLLQHTQRLLGNLGTVFHCLLNEAQELTQKGLVGLINKNMVSSLISKYAQVVLWFCRTGLLPEGSDDDALQISRPFYTHSVISNYYTIRREELTRLSKGKWCADCLMIDGLVGQCGERLTNLWKRDEGGTGQYPPPTLHALLDIYLLDNIDEATKQAIVIYLLLDVMHSFPNKDGASIHSFPSAFAIPIGLVKLVQGLWLLDHHGHQSSFELLLHPAASACHFKWQHERVLNALMCQDQHAIALRYLQFTKPAISSTSQAKLCLSVLLHNRCLIEAWSLVRQHSNQLNKGELLGVLYESCQDLGLVTELLKLPLGLAEQECLEKFLQGTGGLQNRELLMVHYLQQANYIPALQLNHKLKTNLVNERDPKLKERANTRNAILEQYGKVLPRVQRKLAMERAKPYQPPYTIHREVSRPQPLSTLSKRSASEKVISRAGFINSVLTKIEEVWLCKDTTPQSSPIRSVANIQSPSNRPSVFPDPFLGTPITMTSKRKSRLMDLVVQPSCKSPQLLLSPPRPPTSWVSPKSISKAPELSLLQTPQVVKRARALAASGPVFSAFTPQSILRSSLRPTPVATPSASPGRSITPPLRSKESRITFIKEAESPELEKDIQWTNGVAADSEISLLTRGSTLSKAAGNTWSAQPTEEDVDEGKEQPHVKFLPPEGGVASPHLRSFESSSIHEETRTSHTTQTRLSLSFDTTQTPVRSTDTTLEYYDAPLSMDEEIEEQQAATEQDEDVVTLNIKVLTRNEEPEEKPLPTPDQTPIFTLEEDEVVKEDTIFKDLIEEDHEQEAEKDVQSAQEDEQEVESSSKQQYDANLDPEDMHSQVCKQVTETMDATTVVESQDEPVTATEQDFQSYATEITEHLKPCEAIEQTSEPEEDLEQSADLTEFVQQHLFGNDLSPVLTRSGIHSASQIQVSFNSESLEEVEGEEQAAAEPPPVLTSQKSNASVASSEPTGTDSHSVVSVNDSEELSSPASEEDEDEEEEESEEEEEEEESEEEEEEEEEEEDSGSEVEIIEEVQGNRNLPPITPSSVFVQQGHAHFLPSLSEQEAAEFSLITPAVEMKVVEGDMEDEVVMVRVGTNEGGMEDKEQLSSYMELKPSTTLLVPLELVEGQHGPLDLPEIQENVVPDDQRTETHCGFSLMLDIEEDENKEADKLPMENDLQSSNFFIQTSEEEPSDELNEEPVAKPEVILLGTDVQDTPLHGEVIQDDQRKDVNSLDGMEVAELEPEPEKVQTVIQDDQRRDMKHLDGMEVVEPESEPEKVQTVTQHDQRKDMDSLGGMEVDELESEPEKVQTGHQALNMGETEEIEEANVLKDAELVMQAEDPNTAALFVSAPEEELPSVVVDVSVAKKDAAVEEMQDEKKTSTPAVEEIQEEKETSTPAVEEIQREKETPTPAVEIQEEKATPIPAIEEILEEKETPTPAVEIQEEKATPIPAIEEIQEEKETPTPAVEIQEEKATPIPAIEEIQEEKATPIPAVEEIQEEKATPIPAVEEIQEEKATPIPAVEEMQKGKETSIPADEEMQEEKETSIPAAEIQEEKETSTPAEEMQEEKETSIPAAEIQEEKETSTPAEEMQEEKETSIPAAEIQEEKETSTPAEEMQEEKETSIPAVEIQEEMEISTPAVEIQEEKEMPTPAVDQEQPEMNGPSETDTQIVPSAEGETAVEEEQQQDHRASEEITEVTEKKRTTRGRPRKEKKPVNNELDEQPFPNTPTSQRKKAPSTPTRRTTRGRKAVSFISPLPEEEEELEGDEKVEPEIKIPVSTRGTPRKSQFQTSTPRRSTRKTPRDQDEEEEAVDQLPTVTSTSKASSPSRRRVSQKPATTRTSQSVLSSSEDLSPDSEINEEEEEHQEEEVPQMKFGRRTTSKTPTPAKRRSAKADTPRRSSRRILSSSVVEATPLKSLAEENEVEEDFSPPVKHSSRRMKSERLEDDEDKKRQSPSPGRATRQSSRISLDIYPQVKLVPVSLPQSAKKMRQATTTENTNEGDDLHESEQNRNASHSSSRRPARSKLWNDTEEDRPLLNSPLEVDSETPVADALIKRLQQEGGVVVSKMVRTSKKSTKALLEQADALPSVTDDPLPEAPEDELSPGEHSIIYNPPRRRTRAHRAESPGPSEETAAPVTRSRRQVKDATLQDAAASEEDNAEVTTRKKRKTTAKSKSALEPPPEAEVDLISPLPSPGDLLPRSQKRVKEAEAPAPSMNLRRKRIMNMVFTKPVTRRKKL